MRSIKRTQQFKRDYKREKKGRYQKLLDKALMDVVNVLVRDKTLPQRYRDHALAGEWKDCRDCHLKPDLVLIYRKPDTNTLDLIRLGSHSELSL